MYPERSVATKQMHLGKEHMSVSANQVLLVITATVLVNTINCRVFKLTVYRKFKSKIYREIPKINLSVYITPLHLSEKKKKKMETQEFFRWNMTRKPKETVRLIQHGLSLLNYKG